MLLGTGKPARAQGERLGAARRLGRRRDLGAQDEVARASSPRPPRRGRRGRRRSRRCSPSAPLLRHYEFRKYLTKQKPDDEAAEPDDAAEARHPLRRSRQGARRLRALPAPSPTASSSRAISSTSRPTCWAPSSSPSACKRAGEARRRGRDPRRRGRSTELKMGALLAVAQGSVRPARVAIMQWHGAKSKRAKPLGLHRQGRRVRYRRHLHQAGGRHGGHEGRHGRRRLRRRPDACARRAQGQRQRRRHHRSRREHAVGHRRRARATS